MSPLSQFNAYVSSFLPAAAWEFASVCVGLFVLLGVVVQRRFSERFQKSSILCNMDATFLWISHAALAVMGTLAAFVIVDALWPGESPPRVFLLLFLLVYAGIQARTVYQAVAFGVKRSVNSMFT